MRYLGNLLAESARLHPDNLAVSAPDGDWTYAALDDLTNQIAHHLRANGVNPGDRVAVWLEKSGKALATMQAALRCGAVYVPIDPTSPPARAYKVIGDCLPKVVVDQTFDWKAVATHPTWPLKHPDIDKDDLAYILYTSGSTGQPKGVCISHENALACIDWAVAELGVTAADRLSNHAPFHFDISVLDIYPAFATAASVHLIPETSAYVPSALVEFLQTKNISIWYSVPSALLLMLEHGELEARAQAATQLRVLSFAGEPFPMPGLRRLGKAFPRARLLNLYGPTETNVCTFYEVMPADLDRTQPVPIGRACSGNRVFAVDASGREVAVGEEGELYVEGPTVMQGYFGDAPRARGPYPTGDLVRRISEDGYEYIGRRDHMVKIRGHRIELGDIEATLSAHEAIRECAVVVAGSGLDKKLIAFVSVRGESWPGLIALKQFAASRLPRYMIVDKAVRVDALPRTGNGKVDRQTLLTWLAA
jgi:clorobiocin biosynthesis protein CloN4